MSISNRTIDVLYGGNGGGGGTPGKDGKDGRDGVDGKDGAPGKDGVDGAAAGFGTVTATVDDTVGTPTVSVTTSGPNTALDIDFSFTGLKGADGAKGEEGAQGLPGQDGTDGVDGKNADITAITATISEDATGTPKATVTKTGPTENMQLVFDFVNIRGKDGKDGAPGKDGTDGTDAIAALVPRGDYSAGATPAYVVNDYITFTDGSSYVCKKDNPNNVAPTTGKNDDEFWQLMALKGAQGDKGEQGEEGAPGKDGLGFVIRGDYSKTASPTYTMRDTIGYNGKSYICKKDNPGNVAPTTGTATDPYWMLVADAGTAATVTVGTVEGVSNLYKPEVTNSGDTQNAVLDFKLPQGLNGVGGSPFWNWGAMENISGKFRAGSLTGNTNASRYWVSDRYARIFFRVNNRSAITVNLYYIPADNPTSAKFYSLWFTGASSAASRPWVDVRPGDAVELVGVGNAVIDNFDAWAVPAGAYAVPFVDWQAATVDIDKATPSVTTTNADGGGNILWYESPENAAIHISVGGTTTKGRFAIVRPSGELIDDASFTSPIIEKTIDVTQGVDASFAPTASESVIYARKNEVFGIASYTTGVNVEDNINYLKARPLYDGTLKSFVGGPTKALPDWSKTIDLSASVVYPDTMQCLLGDTMYTFYGPSVKAPCDGYLRIYVNATSGTSTPVWSCVKSEHSAIGTCTKSYGTTYKNGVNVYICEPVKKGDVLLVGATKSGAITLSSTGFKLAEVSPIFEEGINVGILDASATQDVTKKAKTMSANLVFAGTRYTYTGKGVTAEDDGEIAMYVTAKSASASTAHWSMVLAPGATTAMPCDFRYNANTYSNVCWWKQTVAKGDTFIVGRTGTVDYYTVDYAFFTPIKKR